MDLTIKEICEQSRSRAIRWHKGSMEAWSVLEWAGAMAGEAGEACNAAKKLKRLEDGMQSINAPGRQLSDLQSAKTQVGLEAADTILYAVCLAACVGVDLEYYLRRAFNTKSEEYGFPERI
jgi:NTP pyrophosphatase (non-canonical NTP hydrolase)